MDFIALIDGDGQMPAEDIAKCYLHSKENNTDITMTYRITGEMEHIEKTLSYIYNSCFKLLFFYGSKRFKFKAKSYKKEVIQCLNLKSNGWTIDAELCFQVMKRKFEVKTHFQLFLGQPGGRNSFVGYKAILFLIFLLSKDSLV